MSSFKDFYNQYNGKSIDVDGVAGPQCVDLAKAWNKALGYSPRYGNGKDWINNAGNDYTRINYTPRAIPKEGDIVSWSGASPANVPYGHVAVATGKGDSKTFQTFDQNWGGPICKLNYHSYQSVQGWIRPKNYQTGGVKMLTKDEVTVLFHYIARKEPSDGLYSYWIGRPVDELLNALKPEGDSSINQYNALAAQLDGANAQIVECQNTNKNLADQIDVLNNEVASLRKQIAEGQLTVPAPSQPLRGYSFCELIRAIIAKVTGGDN
jgi:hypothetical protein